jgi:hypothetical protein
VNGVAFPGASHLWESEHLLRHPPTPDAPWTVITTVREPVAQAVSAFFHAARRSAPEQIVPAEVPALVERFATDGWARIPLRWFEREFQGAVGFDALAEEFDPEVGWGVVETPAVRLLVLRQESFDRAPSALATFLGLGDPVEIPRRNEGATGPLAAIYQRFLADAALPSSLLDEAYESEYATHFYANDEIARFRRRWSR